MKYHTRELIEGLILYAIVVELIIVALIDIVYSGNVIYWLILGIVAIVEFIIFAFIDGIRVELG
jgi:hypothetical protein